MPAVAVTFCGTVGTLAGVAVTTVLVAPDPTAFNALIRKLYCEPFVKPLTVVEATVEFVLAIAVVQLVPPSDDVSTMYPMIALPPSFNGRVHTRTTAPFVGAALSDVGATGTPAGTTEPARLDAPMVTAFNALTRKL